MPVALVQPWGSLFRQEGETVHARPPVQFPHPVWLLFGDKLPPETSGGVVSLRSTGPVVTVIGTLRADMFLSLSRAWALNAYVVFGERPLAIPEVAAASRTKAQLPQSLRYTQ